MINSCTPLKKSQLTARIEEAEASDQDADACWAPRFADTIQNQPQIQNRNPRYSVPVQTKVPPRPSIYKSSQFISFKVQSCTDYQNNQMQSNGLNIDKDNFSNHFIKNHRFPSRRPLTGKARGEPLITEDTSQTVVPTLHNRKYQQKLLNKVPSVTSIIQPNKIHNGKNKRAQSPLFKKIDASKLFCKVEEKKNQNKPASDNCEIQTASPNQNSSPQKRQRKYQRPQSALLLVRGEYRKFSNQFIHSVVECRKDFKAGYDQSTRHTLDTLNEYVQLMRRDNTKQPPKKCLVLNQEATRWNQGVSKMNTGTNKLVTKNPSKSQQNIFVTETNSKYCKNLILEAQSIACRQKRSPEESKKQLQKLQRLNEVMFQRASHKTQELMYKARIHKSVRLDTQFDWRQTFEPKLLARLLQDSERIDIVMLNCNNLCFFEVKGVKLSPRTGQLFVKAPKGKNIDLKEWVPLNIDACIQSIRTHATQTSPLLLHLMLFEEDSTNLVYQQLFSPTQTIGLKQRHRKIKLPLLEYLLKRYLLHGDNIVSLEQVCQNAHFLLSKASVFGERGKEKDWSPHFRRLRHSWQSYMMKIAGKQIIICDQRHYLEWMDLFRCTGDNRLFMSKGINYVPDHRLQMYIDAVADPYSQQKANLT